MSFVSMRLSKEDVKVTNFYIHIENNSFDDMTYKINDICVSEVHFQRALETFFSQIFMLSFLSETQYDLLYELCKYFNFYAFIDTETHEFRHLSNRLSYHLTFKS